VVANSNGCQCIMLNRKVSSNFQTFYFNFYNNYDGAKFFLCVFGDFRALYKVDCKFSSSNLFACHFFSDGDI
jgi:hypothetical protein